MTLSRYQRFFKSDDEHPWPTLRREVFCVDNKCVNEIAEIGKLLKCYPDANSVMLIQSPAGIVEKRDLDLGGELNMLGTIANKKTKPRSSTSEFEGLIGAARAVVRAHALRDDDKASDEDVSDAIAELEGYLPRQRKGTPGRP
jgi:hypothetical protein